MLLMYRIVVSWCPILFIDYGSGVINLATVAKRAPMVFVLRASSRRDVKVQT